MDGATSATIINLASPTNTGDAATKGYVDTQIANLVDSAPGALDTLNELAAALGDDASFSTTVTNALAGKLSLTGGTMTGAIAMGTSKITGLGDPTNSQDAATKTYVDTQRDTRLALSGGTMTGAIAMGTNKITGMGDPTNAQDAATKNYIDTLFGSTTAAAASAAAAAISESNAASSASAASTSATNASNSASAASTSASNAAASYDSFDDRYLGSKSSPPSVDNDGDALLTGALYWNSNDNQLYVWDGAAWDQAAFNLSGGLTTADIGVTVQGYDADTAKYDDVTANFTGTLQNGGSNVVVDTDIGSTVQAYDAGLASIAGLTTAADKMIYTTAADTYAVTDLTSAGRALLDDADASAQRTTLGLAIGVDVQAYDADTAKLDVAQSFTAEQTFKELKDTVHTISDGAGFEIDPANGSIQIVTLGAARTPAATNFEAGQIVLLGIDDGTDYTITWTTVNPTWVKAGGTATAPTLATSGYTWILLWKVGSTIYGTEVGSP
jgi:hypothetical protein